MALTDDMSGNGMVMPVAPMGNYGNGGGFGDCFGGSGWWILLLFILLGNGGWGNGFGGGFGGNDLYPWMNQSNQINGGFRDQMLSTQLNGIQNSVTDSTVRRFRRSQCGNRRSAERNHSADVYQPDFRSGKKFCGADGIHAGHDCTSVTACAVLL